MLVYLLKPILDVVECRLVSAVIHQDDTHGALIISLSNGPESFLSCCVPNLQLQSLVTHINLFDLEIDAYE